MGKFPFLFVFFFLNKWIFHKPPHEFVHYRAHLLPHPHWHSPCDQPREPATSPRRRLAEPRPPRNTTLPDVVVVGVAGPVSVPPLTAHRLSHFQFVFVNANSEYDTRPDGEKKKRTGEKSRWPCSHTASPLPLRLLEPGGGKHLKYATAGLQKASTTKKVYYIRGIIPFERGVGHFRHTRTIKACVLN